MSGLNSLTSRMMRSRSRMSAMRPSIAAPGFLAASASVTACSAGSEFSITSRRATPKATPRSEISDPRQGGAAEGYHPPADLGADRAAAAGHHGGRALDEGFQAPVVDLGTRPQQQVLDRDRRKLQRFAAGVERRQPAGGEAEPA